MEDLQSPTTFPLKFTMNSDPTHTQNQHPRGYRLTTTRIIAISFIFVGVSIAWFVLGGAMSKRTQDSGKRMTEAVEQVWGAPLKQAHPIAWYDTAEDWERKREHIRTSSSDLKVDLRYQALRKGLFLYRTYEVDFDGHYTIPNPTDRDLKVHVSFPMPEGDNSFINFSFKFGDDEAEDVVPVNGKIERSLTIPAGDSVPLIVTYRAQGTNRWDYDLSECDRLRNFNLAMTTDFLDVDFPDGSNSPTDRTEAGDGWNLSWNYPDVIGAQSIAMDMPKVLNAGPVSARISFFAPISLLFFFAVLLIMGVAKGYGLHPMHYFFLGAGCFTFQLLFAYTVDLMSIHKAFTVSALISLFMVGGYIRAVAGKALAFIAVPAQLIFMTLFSYSFFFDGITGLVIAISSVVTLAVLMKVTARTNWDEVFAVRRQIKKVVQSGRRTPPPVKPEPEPNS